MKAFCLAFGMLLLTACATPANEPLPAEVLFVPRLGAGWTDMSNPALFTHADTDVTDLARRLDWWRNSKLVRGADPSRGPRSGVKEKAGPDGGHEFVSVMVVPSNDPYAPTDLLQTVPRDACRAVIFNAPGRPDAKLVDGKPSALWQFFCRSGGDTVEFHLVRAIQGNGATYMVHRVWLSRIAAPSTCPAGPA